MITSYDEFIDEKTKTAIACGFEPMEIKAPLFDWQKHVVRWAVRQGRAALFEDCGLGKTAQQLEWARQVSIHTNAPVLILTPLAVAHQTALEAAKFGIVAKVVESQKEVTGPGIYITNYEKLEHFDPPNFSGVVLDESSILKNFTGKTRIALTEAWSRTPYRLCCTATPSPNDYTEFGQHAAFLGICSPAQMLATFFINDTFNTGDWRLKGHADGEFWKWLASWAACISKPSDIGFSDDGYILPPLNMKTELVEVDERASNGEDLFKHVTLSATTMHRELRETAAERAQAIADMVNASDEDWIVWCNTNIEEEELSQRIFGSIAVRGSDHVTKKESAIQWFQGSLCACKLNPNWFNIQPCRIKNTSTNTTSETKPRKPSSQNLGLQQTGSGSEKILQNTTEPTKANTNAQESSETKETLTEKQNTTPTQIIENKSLPKLRRTEKQGHISGEQTISAPTESPSPTMIGCFPSKKENAQSAMKSQKEEGTRKQSSTLTTATLPEEFAGFSAETVISPWENSKTVLSDLSEPLCICNLSKTRKVLISKSSIFGFGLNLQCCHNVAFVGLSYSFEDFYQALRRSYRFGQKEKVNAYIIQAKTEGAILQSINRKIEQHKTMQEKMKLAALAFTENRIKELTKNTELKIISDTDWKMYHGDCVRAAKMIPDESVDFSVFSPPFADLFTYSDDLQDMGNCTGLSEFTQHFEFLIAEIKRIMVPGREVAVHCCDLLSTKWKHGKIEFQDFSGEIIRAFWRQGFLFHSRICIWKSPVTEMQRTKAHGLLYKTLKSDSCDSRVGCADYLLVFRNPGENPRPVIKHPESYPVDLWQEVASPVWMTIDQGNVLNRDGARDNADERHICPLQLDVIERAVNLWSNPGDLVYSPFAGIGSEGYGALKLGRKFVGSELKKTYFDQSCANLKNAKSQQDLI